MEKFVIENGILKEYNGNDTQIIIPDGVTWILDAKYQGVGVFEGHKELQKVVFPKGLIRIGQKAFRNCTGLTGIVIPDGVLEIGGGAFEGCSGLTSVSLPSGLQKIEYYAFRYCSGLTCIALPDTLTEIGESAFEQCNGINEISFPEGITKLDMDVIGYCNGMIKISLPSSLKILTAGPSIPDSLKEISIDPASSIEKIWFPEYLAKHEFKISPFPMFPLTAVDEPEDKLILFFEYCKEPDKYPQNISAAYEKYGKSQRSRILREASAQNKTDVMAYYERKGKKVSERTLTPEEKSNLLKDTLEKGTDEELKQVLKKYKTIENKSEMLEKSICQGMVSKAQIFLDNNAVLYSSSDCFLDMFENSSITITDKKHIIELCLQHGQIKDPNALYLAAYILNDNNTVEILKKNGKTITYLDMSEPYAITKYYRLFSEMSAEQCIQALNRVLLHCDPEKKPAFYLDETDLKALYHPGVLQFIVDHFLIKYSKYTAYGAMILNAVKNNQPASLQMLLDYLHDELKDEISDGNTDNIRRAIIECVSLQSKDMLESLYNYGLVTPAINEKDNSSTRGWKTKVFNDSISSGSSDLLELIIAHDWISELPSTYNKTDALRAAVRADNSGALEILEKQGWIRTTTTRDSLIELASNEKKTNALAWLLEYKNNTADPVKEENAKERKELIELGEIPTAIWKTRKNSDGTYTVERYLGTDHNLTIPTKIGKRIITVIGKGAFDPESYSGKKNEGFFQQSTNIIISEGITAIEEMAFYSFEKLVSIILPDTLTSIGNDAFAFCDHLENLKIPKRITAISNGLFTYCSAIKEIIIPEKVERIGDEAFYGCDELTSITIPKSVTEFGSDIFEKCSKEKLILHVSKDSAAMQYAEANGFNYTVIDD